MKVTVKLFSAAWCQPCKALKPILQAQAQSLGYDLQVIDVENESYKPYEIEGLPTVVVEVDGNYHGMILAPVTASKIRAMIEEVA